MRRILIILVLLALAAAVAAWLAQDPGEIVIRWRGFEAATTFAFAAAILIGGAVIFGGLLLGGAGLIAWRRRAGLRGQIKTERVCWRSVIDGMTASVAGDPREARRAAARLKKYGGDVPIAAMFEARAAQLEGQPALAEAAWRRLAESPKTALLGYRGLAGDALARGDLPAARRAVAQAFSLAPGARWAFEAAITLAAKDGAWSDVVKILENGQVAGHVTRPRYAAARAAALAARATVHEAEGRVGEARQDLLDALKLAPRTPEIAARAALQKISDGDRGKARALAEKAFAAEPHPALAAVWADAKPNESETARAQGLLKLAQRAPQHDEAKLLTARQHLALGDADKARGILEGLTSSPHVRQRALKIMATAAAQSAGDPTAGAPWIERALSVAPDPVMLEWSHERGFVQRPARVLQGFYRALGLETTGTGVDDASPALPLDAPVGLAVAIDAPPIAGPPSPAAVAVLEPLPGPSADGDASEPPQRSNPS